MRLLTGLLFAGMVLLVTGCGGEPTIADLINDLKTGDVGVRKSALRALELRAAEAREAIPAVSALLEDNVRDVRYRAAKVLSKIGPDASAVPALAATLKDPDPEIRYYAAKSLSTIGPEAESAVPNLIDALQDKANEKSFQYIIKSLRKIGPKAVLSVPVLKELSQNPDEHLRKAAADALASIQPAEGT